MISPSPSGFRLPDNVSVTPFGAILRAVDVLSANFDGVFVVVVFDRRGVGSVVARSRACANDGAASISIHVNPSSMCCLRSNQADGCCRHGSDDEDVEIFHDAYWCVCFEGFDLVNTPSLRWLQTTSPARTNPDGVDSPSRVGASHDDRPAQVFQVTMLPES